MSGETLTEVALDVWLQGHAHKELSPVLVQAVASRLTEEAFRERLEQKGLSGAHVKTLCSLWRDRAEEFVKSAVQRTLQLNRLEDVQWRFGVTASSDVQDKEGVPFVQLNLETTRESIPVEMSLEQFFTLSQELHKAHSIAQSLI